MISKRLHISSKAFRIRICIQFPIYWHRRFALMEVCGQKFLVLPYLDLPPRSIYRHKLRWTGNSAILWFVSGSTTQDSTLLLSKPTLGHDPETFLCVSVYRCKTRLFYIHLNAIPVSYFPNGDFQIIFFAEIPWAFLVAPISVTCPLDYNRLKILGDA